MSANGSQEKLALLMRVASSRLDIVNEADSLVQKTHQQADHFRKLKKKAMSLPVIGSIVGTVGGVLLIRMFTGKKSNPAPPPQPRTSGSWVHSSIFRFIVETPSHAVART